MTSSSLRLARDLRPGDTVLIDLSPGTGTAFTATVATPRTDGDQTMLRLVNAPAGRDIVFLPADGLVELEDDEPLQTHSIACQLRLVAGRDGDDHSTCACTCHPREGRA